MISTHTHETDSNDYETQKWSQPSAIKSFVTGKFSGRYETIKSEFFWIHVSKANRNMQTRTTMQSQRNCLCAQHSAFFVLQWSGTLCTVRCEILKAVTMRITILCNVTQCTLYLRYRRNSYLNFQHRRIRQQLPSDRWCLFTELMGVTPQEKCLCIGFFIAESLPDLR